MVHDLSRGVAAERSIMVPKGVVRPVEIQREYTQYRNGVCAMQSVVQARRSTCLSSPIAQRKTCKINPADMRVSIRPAGKELTVARIGKCQSL